MGCPAGMGSGDTPAMHHDNPRGHSRAVRYAMAVIDAEIRVLEDEIRRLREARRVLDGGGRADDPTPEAQPHAPPLVVNTTPAADPAPTPKVNGPESDPEPVCLPVVVDADPPPAPPPPEEPPAGKAPLPAEPAEPTGRRVRRPGPRILEVAHLLTVRGPQTLPQLAKATGANIGTIHTTLKFPWFRKTSAVIGSPWELTEEGRAAVASTLTARPESPESPAGGSPGTACPWPTRPGTAG